MPGYMAREAKLGMNFSNAPSLPCLGVLVQDTACTTVMSEWPGWGGGSGWRGGKHLGYIKIVSYFIMVL